MIPLKKVGRLSVPPESRPTTYVIYPPDFHSGEIGVGNVPSLAHRAISVVAHNRDRVGAGTEYGGISMVELNPYAATHVPIGIKKR